MKTKILLVFALFLMLTGFNGENRIVEQNGFNLQTRALDEDRAPAFTQKPTIKQNSYGAVIFEARFIGTPQPSVTWYFGSREVKEDSRHKITLKEDNGIYTATLEITNPSLEDTGTYKIIIKNNLGEASAIMNLRAE